MTSEYGIEEARRILGKLLIRAQVNAGPITITRNGRPAAQLVAVRPPLPADQEGMDLLDAHRAAWLEANPQPDAWDSDSTAHQRYWARAELVPLATTVAALTRQAGLPERVPTPWEKEGYSEPEGDETWSRAAVAQRLDPILDGLDHIDSILDAIDAVPIDTAHLQRVMSWDCSADEALRLVKTVLFQARASVLHDRLTKAGLPYLHYSYLRVARSGSSFRLALVRPCDPYMGAAGMLASMLYRYSDTDLARFGEITRTLEEARTAVDTTTDSVWRRMRGAGRS